ncbi:hypothetical protein ACIU1J_01825 [Azospirillum doebereinerae]|uniref:hypothetical protein n=1 Tax=Azospirillum doebereinerae TaxID=92933 RepID=UPI001EE592D5|nr:hypothetical protein [Azospirillum doebereinerae]MCG5240070.1 hypothetical protein [Azospirillum doebereinerae]
MSALLIDAAGCGLMLTGKVEHPTDLRYLVALSEGVTARLAGAPLTANPYLPDTISGWGWASGWAETDPLVSALAATADQGPAS